MSTPLSEDLLGRLSLLATDRFGLRFPPDRWSELARGVASAALERGIPDLEGWAEDLASARHSVDDLAALANHLTISETYFFRQRETFVALENEILPARIAARRAHAGALRIWSAGCASGEEPYSVAILLRHRFPELRPGTAVVKGTDINSRVLQRAEQGVYSEWSFRDAPDWLKGRYFTRRPNGRHEITSEIRQLVRFSPLNLAAPFYPAEFSENADFDVILCRNVLMYFSAEWQEKIIARFTAALTPGGWLMVGPCDVTAAQSAALHLHLFAPGIYEKSEKRKIARPAHDVRPLPSGEMFPPAGQRAVDVPAANARAVEISTAKLAEAVPPAPAEAPSATDEPAEFMAAQAHADRGELDAALAAAERAIAHDTLNASLHYLRGCILQEQNRLEEAAQAFRRVLYLDPGTVMAEFGLGALAERAGRTDDARRHFNAVLRLLSVRNRGEPVPRGEGMTVGRLRDVVEKALKDDAA